MQSYFFVFLFSSTFVHKFSSPLITILTVVEPALYPAPQPSTSQTLDELQQKTTAGLQQITKSAAQLERTF